MSKKIKDLKRTIHLPQTIDHKLIKEKISNYLGKTCINPNCNCKDGFAESHTIQRANLELISEKNKVITFFGKDGILEVYNSICESSNKLYSKELVKHAQTFYLLCKNCDTELFKEYENNLVNILNDNETLGIKQIVRKNFLNTRYFNIKGCIVYNEFKNNLKNLDIELKDYVTLDEIINNAWNEIENYSEFKICYYEKLDYKIQFACQYDFMIENILNMPNIKNKIGFLHIMPYQNYSIILIMTEEDVSENVKNFILDKNDRSEVHDFIIKLMIEKCCFHVNPKYLKSFLNYAAPLLIKGLKENVINKFSLASFCTEDDLNDIEIIITKSDKKLDYLLSEDFNK